MKLAQFLAAAALIACGFAAVPASAQERGDRRIAAIVNRDAITLYDLEQRIRLIGLGARVAEGGEARQRLTAEVLRSMINERLQIQESVRQGVEVTEKEVQDQVIEIERRNRMERGGLVKALRQRNIDPRTFEDQVRASLAWNKVVQVKIQPQIRVSDAEVDVVLKRLLANKDKLQYRVQEIFLPADNPAQLARAQQTAQFVLTQLRGGASFDILARQFSQTGTASSGGDMGLMFEGQMDPEIERAVKQMKTGQIAGPIRGTGGYYIIRLAARRTFTGGNPDVKTIAVAQAAIRLPEKFTPAQSKEAQDRLTKIAAEAKTCDDLVKAAREAGGTGTIVNDLVLEQQRPQVRNLIAPLKAHQTSRPTVEGLAAAVYMRCSDDVANKPPEDKEVREALQRQKLGAFAERYLKELRRSAFVDIRV
jgi:peptidyl-prolyl cis-trans isomerase SurA